VRKREPWSWAGATALVIGGAVAIGWALALIMAVAPWGPPLSDAASDLLATVSGGLLAALGAYMGAAIAKEHHKRDDEPKSDE